MHDLAMFGAVGSSIVFSKTEPIDRAMLQEDPEAIVDASVSNTNLLPYYFNRNLVSG